MCVCVCCVCLWVCIYESICVHVNVDPDGLLTYCPAPSLPVVPSLFRHAMEFFADIIGILESVKKAEKSSSSSSSTLLVSQLATTYVWKAVCMYDQLVEKYV